MSDNNQEIGNEPDSGRSRFAFVPPDVDLTLPHGDTTIQSRFPETFQTLSADPGLKRLPAEMSNTVQTAVLGTLRGDFQPVHTFLNELSKTDAESAQVMSRAYEWALVRAGIRVEVAEDVTPPENEAAKAKSNERIYGANFKSRNKAMDFFDGQTSLSFFFPGQGWTQSNAAPDPKRQFKNIIIPSVLEASLKKDIYK